MNAPEPSYDQSISEEMQNGTLRFAKEIQVLQIVTILPVEFWLESCSELTRFS